jgi:isocitrate/isopropylmalate dehydrogenase
MAKHTIVSMPGDGIGNQVLPEAVRVLNAVGFEAEYVHADIGWELWREEGNALPERTIELLAKHKLGLFGAITSKPKKEADAELRPELRGKGHTYYSPIVTMRQRFNLDVCVRPCIGFPGNPLNFIRKKPGGGFEEPQVNVVVFRQNTEGLRPGGLAAHHHASGGGAHCARGLRVGAEIRVQECDHLREAQRFARDQRNDGGCGQARGQGLPGHPAVVYQHRRANHVADQEPGGLRLHRRQQPVRGRHLRRVRGAGGRVRICRFGEYRERGGGI